MNRLEDPHPLSSEHVRSVTMMVIVLVAFFVLLAILISFINWIKMIASFIF